MNFTLNWLFLYIVTTANIYLQLTIITSIFNSKYTYKKILIAGLILSFINCIPFILIKIPSYIYLLSKFTYLAYIPLFLYLMLSFILYFALFKYKFFKSTLALCVQLILISIMEYIVITIVIMLYPTMDFAKFCASSIFNLSLYRLGLNIFFGIIILVMGYFKITIDLPDNKSKKSAIGIILNFIFTVLIIFPNILFFETHKVDASTQLIIYNLVCVILLFIYNIYTTIMYNNLDTQKLEIESQKLYIDTLEASLDKLRSFKHDFGNIFQSIMGHVKLGNLDKLMVFMEQLQCDVNYVNTASPISSYLKKYPALYGILLSKLSIAEMENIYFNINILKELNLEKVRMYDLCKILGILIDNALEACRESEHNKNVILDINKLDDVTTKIIISNTYKSVELEKIFSKGYTSKLNHTGFGLWEVKNLVNKYNNMFELTTNADSIYFSQTLIIKNV